MEYSKQQFERLFRENYPMMYRLAFSLLEDGEEAKNAVHQVFTDMWHCKPQVEEAALRKRVLQRRMEAEYRLKEQDRRILSLHYDDEMTYIETAEALGISASAVNKHITRSLSKIRTFLKIAK